MPLRKADSFITPSDVKIIEQVVAGAKQAAKPATKQATYSDAKGRQISRQGLFQAALQSPALMQYAVDLDAYLVLVRKVADAGFAFVNE